MTENELRRQSDALELRMREVEQGLVGINTTMGFVRDDIAGLKDLLQAHSGTDSLHAKEVVQCQTDLAQCNTSLDAHTREIKVYKRWTWASMVLIVGAGLKQIFIGG